MWVKLLRRTVTETFAISIFDFNLINVQEFLIDLSLGIGAFSMTNIDDLLLLTFYFTSNKYRTVQVVSGQFIGIGVLVLISLVGAFLGKLIPSEYLHWLGIFPLLLGIKELIGSIKSQREEEVHGYNVTSAGLLGIAGVTIANGGDNLGVYTPLFARSSATALYVYVFAFTLMTSIWCFLAYKFTSHKKVKSVMVKYGKIIFPYFLLCLGLLILFN